MTNERNSARDLIARALPWVSPSVQADLRRVDAVLEALIEAADEVMGHSIGDDTTSGVAAGKQLSSALELAEDCVTCPRCNGGGSIEVRHPSGNPELDTEETCGACHGTGEVQP